MKKTSRIEAAQDTLKYLKELLYDENYISYFENIIFAVLDNSKNQECINAFKKLA